MSTIDDLLAQIDTLLQRSPNLTARQIAEELGVDRQMVNYLLDGPLRGKVFQDNSYRWRLAEVTKTQSRPEAVSSLASNTPLARLCNYYLGCLSFDEDSGVSLFASSKHNLDYFEPGLRSLDEALVNGVRVNGMQTLLRRLGRDLNRKTLVLGYPIRLRYHRARSGWSGYKVEPVMLFTLNGTLQDLANASFELLPTVNFAHLKSMGMGGSGDIIREAIQLTDDLGLANDTGAVPELDELFSRLRALRSEWDWQEAPDVYSLSSGTKIEDLKSEGIYNRAIICGIELSIYTRGLESELERLVRLPNSSYEDTALGSWISRRVQEHSAIENSVLLEPLPLNSEQRTAVEHALTRPLTVITGPPGTGKSQVVTALLMNAAWNGKRVLFASKNNKAVDVVEERVNAYGSRPIMLRLGNNEHRSALAGQLSSLLGSRATTEDQDNYNRHIDMHRSLTQQRENLTHRLERILSLRNQTDHLEQRVEGLRLLLGEHGFKVARDMPITDISNVHRAAVRLQTAMCHADKDRQSSLVRMFWFLLRSRRNQQLVKTKQDFYITLEQTQLQDLIATPTADSPTDWEEFTKKVAHLSNALPDVQAYFSSLADLQLEGHPEEVALDQMKLADAMAENAHGFWQSWLHLQPERLRSEDRRVVGEFSALLELIVRADQEDRPVERSMYPKYYQLLPKVANVLPCWAVTSLSARGRLPLEAGMFDLLVIDEASQCDIASALPLLYRSKNAVILGDPQQLKHISALRPDKDSQLLLQHKLDADFISWSYSAHSLFDLASSLCDSDDIVTLRDHHRSHADIVGFSNEQFYENRLRIATDHSRLKIPARDAPAIRWVDLEGRVVRPSSGSAVNEEEAQAVVKELKHLLQQGYHGTIGVVSPFRAQANRIRDILERDGDTSQRLISNDCLIDTVHRFQGDERDVMIFSPVVSSGITDNALRFLAANGNLFNVAITRARSALVVVGDKATSASSEVEYLKRFVEYTDSLADDRSTYGDTRSLELGPAYPTVSRPERVSDWERYFYKVLYQYGHRPIPQYTVDQYDLDFALFGSGEHKLNIEVDGERYHRDWDGELCRRDQLRNQRLMEIGWDVMRFWVYEIRDDLDRCLARVNDWVAQHGTREAT